MTITCEIWEDTGAVSAGHGTTRISVTNIGWKNSGLDETNAYVYYPLMRPAADPLYWSFTRYNYLKLYGTYPQGSRPRIEISGSTIGSPPSGYAGTGKTKLYYKLTNTYAVPSNAFDGTLIYLPPGVTQVVYPKLSTVGPEAATSYLKYLIGNTTYWSQYIVTQLHVEQGSLSEYGNIGQLTVKVFMDEYESTDV